MIERIAPTEVHGLPYFSGVPTWVRNGAGIKWETTLVLGYRLAAPSPGDVVKQAVNTLDEEAVPPAPDRRLRHAGGPHRPRQLGADDEERKLSRPRHGCGLSGCGLT